MGYQPAIVVLHQLSAAKFNADMFLIKAWSYKHDLLEFYRKRVLHNFVFLSLA